MNTADEFDIRWRCIEKCKDFFENVLGVSKVEFEKVVGKSETYFKLEIFVKDHKLNIYIYYDGAEFIIDDDYNPRFEMVDYNSEEELIEAFLAELKGQFQ